MKEMSKLDLVQLDLSSKSFYFETWASHLHFLILTIVLYFIILPILQDNYKGTISLEIPNYQ